MHGGSSTKICSNSSPGGSDQMGSTFVTISMDGEWFGNEPSDSSARRLSTPRYCVPSTANTAWTDPARTPPINRHARRRRLACAPATPTNACPTRPAVPAAVGNPAVRVRTPGFGLLADRRGHHDVGSTWEASLTDVVAYRRR